jgi:hypothetical protein
MLGVAICRNTSVNNWRAPVQVCVTSAAENKNLPRDLPRSGILSVCFYSGLKDLWQGVIAAVNSVSWATSKTVCPNYPGIGESRET